jgi:hypothetical protein
MYNLTVDKAHTFFVGDGQWLVHNGCQNLKFWNEPIEIGGRRVYQRNDLFELTPSNISLMEQGMASFGYDGKRVVLHHLTQDEPGALAEVAGRYHEVNKKTLHGSGITRREHHRPARSQELQPDQKPIHDATCKNSTSTPIFEPQSPHTLPTSMPNAPQASVAS